MSTDREPAAQSACALRDLPITECTLPAILSRQANTFTHKPLLTIDGHTFSYRQVRDRAAQVAGMLAAHGVTKGTRVVTLCGNRLELLDLFLGCGWIGAVLVPLNNEIRGEGLRHILQNSKPLAIAVEADLLHRLDRIDLPPSLQHVWSIGDIATPAALPVPVTTYPPLAEPLDAIPLHPGDPLAILYTSGTSGVSKGVICPHAQMYWWGVNVSEQLGITDTDVLYTCLPLFHTNALNAFMQALVSGASFVVGRRFSASGYWQELRDSNATVTYLLGAMINILWSKAPTDLDRAHRTRIALSPATPAALSRPFTERFGIVLLDGFGSTETNSVMSANPPRPGYLGLIQKGFEAVVVDDNDCEVPDGQSGELLLRSRAPYAFALGYFEMPQETVKAWRNLWFHTGDRVVREDGKWYRFLDRKKDVIRRRGENISSFELEQTIALLPQVESVAAYPVPSEMAEDEVMVSIVLKPDVELDREVLVRHCTDNLPRFAVPRFIDIVPQMPTTANGKVRKNVLRDTGVTATTWDRLVTQDGVTQARTRTVASTVSGTGNA
ncbi:ATP-dependent acyl-CoA ligase [Leekyejoonella antrihumi]|uniref:ATP-dependent acyl-CoA ligase n=1 Tax=Leekyejoonella antrihumi TaxID=1660198 RepID=UPI001C93B638|nr:ATP-dependent acyl-CoA ligase [Leekyejoonella antrihumi]